MCWPASHAFHFSFCKIAQSKGRALRQDYLKVVLKGWFNKENKIRSLLRLNVERQDYLTVVLRGWLNKENKIRSLLRILFFFYASKCSNQSLWHFAA
jgi:hypothetical protein